MGSGTGTSTPPGRTHCRQWPPVMNSGTAGRPAVGSGVGKIGSSAAPTASGTSRRARPVPRRARSTASTSSVATSGSNASANRIGNAPSTTGSPPISAYGPGMRGPVPPSTTSGPSESAPITRPATTQARTSRRRPAQIAQTAATSSSGQPRKVLYSAGPVVSRAASSLPATDSGESVHQLLRSAEK